jgi:hypothetical protein
VAANYGTGRETMIMKDAEYEKSVQEFRRALRPIRRGDKQTIYCCPLKLETALEILLAVNGNVKLTMSNGRATRSVTKFLRDNNIQQTEHAVNQHPHHR